MSIKPNFQCRYHCDIIFLFLKFQSITCQRQNSWCDFLLVTLHLLLLAAASNCTLYSITMFLHKMWEVAVSDLIFVGACLFWIFSWSSFFTSASRSTKCSSIYSRCSSVFRLTVLSACSVCLSIFWSRSLVFSIKPLVSCWLYSINCLFSCRLILDISSNFKNILCLCCRSSALCCSLASFWAFHLCSSASFLLCPFFFGFFLGNSKQY